MCVIKRECVSVLYIFMYKERESNREREKRKVFAREKERWKHRSIYPTPIAVNEQIKC